MRKYLTVGFLREFGWSVKPGGSVVSFCETCGAQRVHVCTGQKQENGSTILRLECSHCIDRLNGVSIGGMKV